MNRSRQFLKGTAAALALSLMATLLDGCSTKRQDNPVGSVEHLIATADGVEIEHVMLLTARGEWPHEIRIRGALLEFLHKNGEVWYLKVLPNTKFDGSSDFRIDESEYVKDAVTRHTTQAFGSMLNTRKEIRGGTEVTVNVRFSQTKGTSPGTRLRLAGKLRYSVSGTMRDRGAFFAGLDPAASFKYNEIGPSVRFMEASHLLQPY